MSKYEDEEARRSASKDKIRSGESAEREENVRRKIQRLKKDEVRRRRGIASNRCRSRACR